MADTFWHKQASGQPLFGDLLWSRPETKTRAGKLLIVGGNKFGFAIPAEAYGAAKRAGIGSVRIFLPEVLRRVIGTSLAEAEFGPVTPSGSFSRQALAQLLDLAQWSDGVLLAGDFGRNSETAILLEHLLQKYKGQVSAAQDSLDYFLNTNSPLINRDRTTSIINLGKLQKLAKFNRPDTPILHSMLLRDLVQLLHQWTPRASGIITKHAGHLIVACAGQVSTTPTTGKDWQAELGAYASVWCLQQPQKPFAALTSAVYDYAYS